MTSYTDVPQLAHFLSDTLLQEVMSGEETCEKDFNPNNQKWDE